MDFHALLVTPSFWFDVICGMILIVFCSRYVKIGFLAAIIQIFGTFISIVGAYVFASFADTIVYEFLFEEALAQQLEKLITDGGASGMETLSEIVLSVLPSGMQGSFQDISSNVALLETTGGTEQMVQAIMENIVSPMVTQVVFMALFFIGFAVCRMVVYLLVKLLKAANYIPVLGSVNRVLGWVLGVVGGALDFYLVFCVLWGIILLTGDTIPIVNTTDLANSWFFEFFVQHNPFQ